MSARLAWLAGVVALALAACGDDGQVPASIALAVSDDVPTYGTAPFPSDVYVTDARVGPIPGIEPLLGPDAERLLRHVATLDGFGLRPPVELFIDGALDADALPARTETVHDALFVVDVDDASPAHGVVVPMDWRYDAERGRIAGSPAFGTTLREGTRYAVVATDGLRDAAGRALTPSPGLLGLLDGTATPARWASTAAIARDVATWPLAGRLVGVAVFTTQHASGTLLGAREAMDNDELVPRLSFPDPTLIFRGPEALDALLGRATRWTTGPRAGTERWGDDNPTGLAHDHVGVFASGMMLAPRFRRDDTGTEEPDDETFDVNVIGGTPRLINVDRIPVSFTLPNTPMPPDGYPVLIFGHGLGASRAHLLPLLEPFTSAGFAVVAIDFVSHGSRRDPTDRRNNAAGRDAFTGDPDLHDGLADHNGPPSQLEFFESFLNVSGIRDGIRQSALDLCTVTRMIRRVDLELAALAAPGEPAPRLDARHPVYVGESFGTVVGTVFAGIEPHVGLYVLDVPGGGILDLILPHSETIGTATLPLLDLLYDLERPIDRFDPFVGLAQALLDPADPLTFAPHILRDRFSIAGRVLGPRHVLAIEVAADQIMPNVSTWALARGLGLAELTPSLTVAEGLAAVSSPAAGNIDGQTGVLVEYSPATHGANWTHAAGDLAFAITYPEAASAPFVPLASPVHVDNPIYETHAQVAEAIHSYLGDGVPSIVMTRPPLPLAP